MNALHPAANFELSEIFDRLGADKSLRAIILTGAGSKAFCAGYDLRDNVENGELRLPDTGFGGLGNRFDYALPIIAAVNGVAFGGGFEMALACDLIIACATASFALPEPKVGWAALGGGVQRLPRAIGMKRAMSIILTGRTVSAAEGFSLGFVNEVVAPEALLDAARRWAREIVACAPLAVLCSRDVANRGADAPDLRTAMDVMNIASVKRLLASEDAAEGRRAFVERRPPRWTGR